jgi:hypothetical protein
MKKQEYTFSQKEMLSIVATVGLTPDRYNNWERPDRGIMPVVATGRGNRRKYSLDDVAYLALVTVLADKLPYLAQAAKLAAQMKSSVVNVLNSGSWDEAPIFILFCGSLSGEWVVAALENPSSVDLRRFFRMHVHPRYMPPVLVDCGNLALELAGGLSHALRIRGAKKE